MSQDQRDQLEILKIEVLKCQIVDAVNANQTAINAIVYRSVPCKYWPDLFSMAHTNWPSANAPTNLGEKPVKLCLLFESYKSGISPVSTMEFAMTISWQCKDNFYVSAVNPRVG
jgi:hypothetical protein